MNDFAGSLPINRSYIRECMVTTSQAARITIAGQPLEWRPHDFRRIFVTDALRSGLPPRIAAKICGHTVLDTTMGYAAIYPEDVVSHHRAFIARRRAERPSEEYRDLADGEWDEFLALPVDCTSSGSSIGRTTRWGCGCHRPRPRWTPSAAMCHRPVAAVSWRRSWPVTRTARSLTSNAAAEKQGLWPTTKPARSPRCRLEKSPNPVLRSPRSGRATARGRWHAG